MPRFWAIWREWLTGSGPRERGWPTEPGRAHDHNSSAVEARGASGRGRRFLWDVAEVVKKTPSTITVRLCSDFSSIHDHWTIRPDGTPGGILKTFHKSTRLESII